LVTKKKKAYTGRPLEILLALPDAGYVSNEEAALMLGVSPVALTVRRYRDEREGRPVWPRPIYLGRLIRYQAGNIRHPPAHNGNLSRGVSPRATANEIGHVRAEATPDDTLHVARIAPLDSIGLPGGSRPSVDLAQRSQGVRPEMAGHRSSLRQQFDALKGSVAARRRGA
jgi:hypothetical protein